MILLDLVTGRFVNGLLVSYLKKPFLLKTEIFSFSSLLIAL